MQESLGISFSKDLLRIVHLKKSWGEIRCAASGEFAFSPSGGASQTAEAAAMVKQFVLTHKVKPERFMRLFPRRRCSLKK